MFIAILTYKKPLSEVDRFLAAHQEYLAKHYAAGDFIASGPQTIHSYDVLRVDTFRYLRLMMMQ